MSTKIVLLCLVLTASGCAAATAGRGPQATIAFNADQIVVRVNELERTAVQANQGGGLNDATTRIILTWTRAADVTLKTTPAGWVQSLKTSFAEVQKQLPAGMNPTVQLAITALGAILAGLQ